MALDDYKLPEGRQALGLPPLRPLPVRPGSGDMHEGQQPAGRLPGVVFSAWFEEDGGEWGVSADTFGEAVALLAEEGAELGWSGLQRVCYQLVRWPGSMGPTHVTMIEVAP